MGDIIARGAKTVTVEAGADITAVGERLREWHRPRVVEPAAKEKGQKFIVKTVRDD